MAETFVRRGEAIHVRSSCHTARTIDTNALSSLFNSDNTFVYAAYMPTCRTCSYLSAGKKRDGTKLPSSHLPSASTSDSVSIACAVSTMRGVSATSSLPKLPKCVAAGLLSFGLDLLERNENVSQLYDQWPSLVRRRYCLHERRWYDDISTQR
jgi:hypothetical protein